MQAGQYGKDPEADFVADAAADAYSDWVNAWAALIGKPASDEAVKTYRNTRSKFYNTLEWYYCKKASSSSAFLSGGAMLSCHMLCAFVCAEVLASVLGGDLTVCDPWTIFVHASLNSRQCWRRLQEKICDVMKKMLQVKLTCEVVVMQGRCQGLLTCWCGT